MGGMTDLSDSHTISIGVLDNDSLALNAIAVMTSRLSPRFHIIWSTTSPAMALQRCMTHGARPDVLVVDMALGGITGADICARIRRRTPTIGLVCVTSYDLDPYRQDAVEAGAQCLIAKDDIVKELPQAIRCAAQGEPVPGTGFPTAREANRKLNEGHATEGRLPENDKPSLSSRERDVLRLYAHGSSTDEIAALLNVSKGSVFTYVNRACRRPQGGPRHMRPIRSALNRIHHPAILAAGLVLAVAIPVEMGVYSSQNLLSWSTIRISLLVAVLCAMLGAAPVWAACLLFAVSGYALLWLFSPLTTIMIAALTSIAVLSFVKPRLGAASALAALAALAANNMQNNLTSSNIVGMIIMCLCPLSLGFSLNLLFAQRQATATLRQRLDREHTARHLHDTISNDLAYMILRIDQASRSDCPADREQYQRQLTDLRAIAETALDHTHQVIRQLERTDKPDDCSRIVKTNNDDKTDRKIEQQRERLDGIIQSQRRRLGGLGFQGDDILGTFDHPLADDILDLLEGLLNELYANIAKHAAPHEWYAVTISFDRRHVIISASDVLKDEAVRLGLGSGLKRYRTVIESMSGTFDITDDSDNWNANITIPLSVTRR